MPALLYVRLPLPDEVPAFVAVNALTLAYPLRSGGVNVNSPVLLLYAMDPPPDAALLEALTAALALDISPPPLCPGDASCNNVDPPFANTGSNVGRLIILLGSLLMMAGGFILSRGYRF